jgi:hypothetical protein
MVSQEGDFYFHKFSSTYRTEQLPFYSKDMMRKQGVLPAFNKNNSVFKEWHEPSEADLNRILMHDIFNWKVSRFIKEVVDVDKVVIVLRSNLLELLEIFIEL